MSWRKRKGRPKPSLRPDPQDRKLEQRKLVSPTCSLLHIGNPRFHPIFWNLGFPPQATNEILQDKMPRDQASAMNADNGQEVFR